jgi:hypothetical protein
MSQVVTPRPSTRAGACFGGPFALHGFSSTCGRPFEIGFRSSASSSSTRRGDCAAGREVSSRGAGFVDGTGCADGAGGSDDFVTTTDGSSLFGSLPVVFGGDFARLRVD